MSNRPSRFASTHAHFAAVAGLVLLTAAAIGCAPGAPVTPASLAVTDAWIRPASAGQTTAAYLTVTGGATDDRLLGGVFPDASAAELHETVIEGDMVRMEARPEGMVVPAGGELALAPRGAHLMLVDLTRDLTEGERVPLTLMFESAGVLTTTAEVRQEP